MVLIGDYTGMLQLDSDGVVEFATTCIVRGDDERIVRPE
jgi:hypothetical protein